MPFEKSPAQLQLERELGFRLTPFAALGAVDSPQVNSMGSVMAKLRGGRQQAATAYRMIMHALWGEDRPERTDPQWWWSPLGLMLAEVATRIGAEGSMTQLQAAAVLGVNKPTVSSYVRRKILPATPSGQPLTSAVLNRLVRQGGPSHHQLTKKAMAS